MPDFFRRGRVSPSRPDCIRVSNHDLFKHQGSWHTSKIGTASCIDDESAMGIEVMRRISDNRLIEVTHLDLNLAF